MKIILKDMEPDDWVLGIRAAKWLFDRVLQQDALLSYGTIPNAKDFYAKRNKASITVRPCDWAEPTSTIPSQQCGAPDA